MMQMQKHHQKQQRHYEPMQHLKERGNKAFGKVKVAHMHRANK